MELEYCSAWVCGDVCVWKPSEKTPICGIACQNLWADVAKENDLPEGISCLVTGDYEVGEYLTTDERIPLISQLALLNGKNCWLNCSKRFGKSLLELGGNNAIIVTPNADLKITVIGSFLVQ